MGCEEICAILARCVKVVRPSSFVAILDHAKASEVFQDIFDLETVCPSSPRRLVACRHNATGPSRPSAWVAGLEPRCPGPSVGSGEELLSASRR